MSSSTEDIKKKASSILSSITSLTEKRIHKIIDKGAKAGHIIEEYVVKAYDEIVDIIKDLREKEIKDLQDGDLVISPDNVIIDGKVKFLKGEIFEFDSGILPYIKNPLFEPDIRAAVKWSRNKELDDIANYFTDLMIEGYVKNRKNAINKNYEQQPTT